MTNIIDSLPPDAPHWYDSEQSIVYTTDQSMIVNLRNRLAAAETDHRQAVVNARRLSARCEAMQADFKTIERRLNSEANSRSWCSEYDSISADINRELSTFEFSPRKRVTQVEYVVRVDVTYPQDGDFPDVRNAIENELADLGGRWDEDVAEVSIANVFAR